MDWTVEDIERTGYNSEAEMLADGWVIEAETGRLIRK